MSGITASPLKNSIHDPYSITLEENSTLRKVVSCIPVIGTIISPMQEASLANKIRRVSDVFLLTFLIEVKNEYKMAAAVRNLIIVAFVVVRIASGIFTATPILLITLSIHVGLAALNSYEIYQNNKVINELETDGFKQGLKIR